MMSHSLTPFLLRSLSMLGVKLVRFSTAAGAFGVACPVQHSCWRVWCCLPGSAQLRCVNGTCSVQPSCRCVWWYLPGCCRCGRCDFQCDRKDARSSFVRHVSLSGCVRLRPTQACATGAFALLPFGPNTLRTLTGFGLWERRGQDWEKGASQPH